MITVFKSWTKRNWYLILICSRNRTFISIKVFKWNVESLITFVDLGLKVTHYQSLGNNPQPSIRAYIFTDDYKLTVQCPIWSLIRH